MARGFRRPRNVGEAIGVARKLPTYARLVWGLARDPRVPIGQKAVLGAVAAYLVFPIDILPDFIPFLGQLDDVALVLFAMDWFIKNAPPEVVNEHLARIAKHDDVLTKDLATAGSALRTGAEELRVRLEGMRARRERNDQG